MTELYGLGVLALGVGCLFAARIVIEEEARSRELTARNLHRMGRTEAALRELERGPSHGPLLCVLCGLGGWAVIQGWIWMFD